MKLKSGDSKFLTKSIPEMTWDEILALPTRHVPNNKIVEFRKNEAARGEKKRK